jgi:subtilisin family serine protease
VRQESADVTKISALIVSREHSDLANEPETGALFNGNYSVGEVLVRFKAGTSGQEQEAARARSGVAGVRKRIRPRRNPQAELQLLELEPGVSVEEAIARLKLEDTIEYAVPNHRRDFFYTPNDPYFPVQWGLNNTGQTVSGVSGVADADIDAPEAWEIERGLTTAVAVAVIDTGIDLGHPDLSSKIWNNVDEIPGNLVDDDNNGFVDDNAGWDFVGNDNVPSDDYGHGTHVSGIVGAASNNSTGVAGVSPGAKIMSLRAGDKRGLLDIDIIAAMFYATDNGARVVNMSFGSYFDSAAIQDAINYAYSNGVVLLAAVGNEFDTRVNYPAGDNHVIGVGATNSSDIKADFSNYNRTVDVVAPGVNIYSTMPTYPVQLTRPPYNYSQNYDYLDGTSMATPHAAGLAALLLSKDSALTPDGVELIMETKADDLGVPGRDDYYGFGRINAFSAISADTVPPAAVTDLAVGTRSTSSVSLSWTAPGDDGNSGTASQYDIRYSTSPITEGNWDLATQVDSEPIPQLAGATESFSATGLSSETSYYFAIKARDEVSNWSPISNLLNAYTLNVADINKDGTVNIFDLVKVGRAFGSVPEDPNWDPEADLRSDNVINIFDLVMVGRNFGRSVP